MSFKELMNQRESILQGIEEQEQAYIKQLEEEHYEKVLQIIKEQAIAIQRDA